MGDRFYEQQGKFKPKRVLKKDIIIEINEILGAEVYLISMAETGCNPLASTRSHSAPLCVL